MKSSSAKETSQPNLTVSSSSEVDWTAIAKGILIATAISGTLDAIAGVVVFDFVLGQMGIVQVLQWIASGVFGKDAFTMGLGGAAWGVVFHYLIAFGFSAGLFGVYRRLPVLRDYPVFSGLAYGGYIWVAMNFIVLPLSNTVIATFSPGVALTGFVWHMLLVGLPINLVVKRTLR